MAECPRCGSEVDELHFLPPEVITHEILEALEPGAEGTTREACGECIHSLMEA